MISDPEERTLSNRAVFNERNSLVASEELNK